MTTTTTTTIAGAEVKANDAIFSAIEAKFNQDADLALAAGAKVWGEWATVITKNMDRSVVSARCARRGFWAQLNRFLGLDWKLVLPKGLVPTLKKLFEGEGFTMKLVGVGKMFKVVGSDQRGTRLLVFTGERTISRSWEETIR